MPTGVLIDTTNRLLGWSTGDFSLYGAQPAVTIGMPHDAADPSLLTVPSATPPPASPSQAAAPEAPSAAPPADDRAAPAFPDANPAAALSALHALATSDAASLAPQVASPTGSGSIAPIVADTALPVGLAPPDDGHAAAALTQGQSAASLAAPVFAAGDAASASLAALAPATLALVTPVFDTAIPTVGDVAAALTPATGAVAASAQLLDGVLHDAALPAVQTSISGIADALPGAQALADTASGLADTVSATVHDAAATPAAAAIDTLIDTAAGLTATALPDDHLGGTDPAGGVTTLVSMVETADLFEVVPSAADIPAIATGGSIVDTLAADALPDALLGDAAHHATDALVPHHDDHGGLGL